MTKNLLINALFRKTIIKATFLTFKSTKMDHNLHVILSIVHIQYLKYNLKRFLESARQKIYHNA